MGYGGAILFHSIENYVAPSVQWLSKRCRGNGCFPCRGLLHYDRDLNHHHSENLESRNQGLFSSPRMYPEGVWGPPSLLSNGYSGLFLRR